jgi:hypothetical protein
METGFAMILPYRSPRWLRLVNDSEVILAVKQLGRAMRNGWLMTRLETAIFIAGVMFLAGGAVWATAIR